MPELPAQAASSIGCQRKAYINCLKREKGPESSVSEETAVRLFEGPIYRFCGCRRPHFCLRSKNPIGHHRILRRRKRPDFDAIGGLRAARPLRWTLAYGSSQNSLCHDQRLFSSSFACLRGFNLLRSKRGNDVLVDDAHAISIDDISFSRFHL